MATMNRLIHPAGQLRGGAGCKQKAPSESACIGAQGYGCAMSQQHIGTQA